MKLPHTPASAMSLINFGRDDRPARPRTRPDLRSELPRLPADLPEHRRTSTTSAAIKRWRSVRRRPRAAPRNAWSIHISAGRRPSAASVNSSLSLLKIGSLRRPARPAGRVRHSPAVGAERERPRWGLGGSRRVGLQAAPGGFDLSVARALAAGPLLGGGRTVLRHVVAHDRTRNSTQNAGLFTRKSGAWCSQTQRQHTHPT